MKTFLIRVSGRVQGVGFRARVAAWARSKQIAGWASNQDDGSVLVMAVADEKTLGLLVEWLQSVHSPFGADVKNAVVGEKNEDENKLREPPKKDFVVF